MNFKQSALVCIAMVALACNSPATNNNAKDSAANEKVVAADNYLDSFKQAKAEKAFLTSLFTKMDLKPAIEKSRLLKLEEVKLYGGTKPYTLAYIDYNDGSTVLRPYKALFIVDAKGEVKDHYTIDKYELVNVFEHKDPLLVIVEEIGNGEGVHHFIGVEKDSLKDFLEEGGKGLSFLTKSISYYSPETVQYKLEDVNNDGQKDIVFTGRRKDLFKPSEEQFEMKVNASETEGKIIFTGRKIGEPFSVNFIWIAGRFNKFEPDFIFLH